LELAVELAREIDDVFRVEVTGCPKDCRLALERSDAGLVLAEDGRGLTVWLGGRHRFGRPPIQPEPFAFFEITEAWPAMDLIFRGHDLWYTHRLPEDETLPEMVRRLGQKFYRLAQKPLKTFNQPPPNAPNPEALTV
jgi:dissimilatory sulfite reductase (desulfoviridin) alpha/beta subunit